MPRKRTKSGAKNKISDRSKPPVAKDAGTEPMQARIRLLWGAIDISGSERFVWTALVIILCAFLLSVKFIPPTFWVVFGNDLLKRGLHLGAITAILRKVRG